jgi:hypothetical protein
MAAMLSLEAEVPLMAPAAGGRRLKGHRDLE